MRFNHLSVVFGRFFGKERAHSCTAYLFQSKQKKLETKKYREKNSYFILVFVYEPATQHLMAIGNNMVPICNHAPSTLDVH